MSIHQRRPTLSGGPLRVTTLLVMADTTDTTNERLDEMLLEAKKQTRYLSIIYGLAVAWTVAAAAGAFIAISIAMDSGS